MVTDFMDHSVHIPERRLSHTNRNERRIDRPLTFDKPNSIKLKKTMTMSKQFHLSLR